MPKRCRCAYAGADGGERRKRKKKGNEKKKEKEEKKGEKQRRAERRGKERKIRFRTTVKHVYVVTIRRINSINPE